jgi:hypothetical protein
MSNKRLDYLMSVQNTFHVKNIVLFTHLFLKLVIPKSTNTQTNKQVKTGL